MTGKLCILCCRNFHGDLAAAVAAEGWTDVVVSAFPARCGRPPVERIELRSLVPAGSTAVVVLGRACLKGLAKQPPGDGPPMHLVPQTECFHLVAGKTLVADLIGRGSYLVTPSWLADWPAHLREMGFDPDTASEFFQDFATDLVLLDTGSTPDAPTRLAELSASVRLPSSRIAVGIDHTRALLARHVLEWRLDQERRSAREVERRHAAEIADHVSSMHFLQRLTQLRDEAEVVATIEEIFLTLFAPEDFFYLNVEGGTIRADAAPAAALDQARAMVGDWAWTTSGSGFIVRIGSPEQTVGLVLVDRLAFPEFKDRYLNLALLLTGACALAIENARAYQKLQRTGTELENARDAAQAASKAKSQFIANMSHELRTPLNAIIGYSQFLQWNEPRAERRDQLEAISSAGHHLLSLIQDILDLSKIEAGRISTTMAPFNVADELHGVESLFSAEAMRKGLSFTVRMDPTLPPALRGDAGLLRQILINLVGNAIKFTSTGSVELRVERGAGQVGSIGVFNRVHVQFHVSDTGIGIKPENQLRIFEMFEQEDDTYTRRFGGTGLGLAITRRLVSLLNGRIWLESVPNRGSRFSVMLPFESIAPAVPTAIKPLGDNGGTILVVDDDQATRWQLVKILERERFNAVAAESGESALSLLHQQPFDLILMDIKMPGLNGVEVTRHIRDGRVPGCHGIPIIAVTACVRHEDRERFLAEGMTDYLSKPIETKSLLTVVERHIHPHL